jgi:hypothetical protein
MYQKKEYRTLRAVANVTAGFGWLIVAGFFLVGFFFGVTAGGFFSGIFLGIVLGAAFGLGFIVYGQLVSVFLDQKDLLEEILEEQRASRKAG